MVLEKPASAGFFSPAIKLQTCCIAKRLHVSGELSSLTKASAGLIYFYPLSTGSAAGSGKIDLARMAIDRES